MMFELRLGNKPGHRDDTYEVLGTYSTRAAATVALLETVAALFAEIDEPHGELDVMAGTFLDGDDWTLYSVVETAGEADRG